MTLKPDPLSYAPRGLSREEAARYVGLSCAGFDRLIAARLMPRPRQVGGRVIWDRVELDIAFSDLPHQGAGNYFDKAS